MTRHGSFQCNPPTDRGNLAGALKGLEAVASWLRDVGRTATEMTLDGRCETGVIPHIYKAPFGYRRFWAFFKAFHTKNDNNVFRLAGKVSK